ncbi:type I-E CRISPR-associated protein Cas5/CasD [Streptomyces sp. NPDC004609]|uniref:type I-E CRISPR-associated protein Cas5/CasD n=1 Tax=Streptomyces sp. NPDC004609 TaxID=3364704 RepID=UPI0036B1485D
MTRSLSPEEQAATACSLPDGGPSPSAVAPSAVAPSAVALPAPGRDGQGVAARPAHGPGDPDAVARPAPSPPPAVLTHERSPGFLLQLGGPLQSWGEHSAFADRDTVAHPTRSGLIGMIASALGIPRAEATTAEGSRFAHLPRLRFTVRVDRPGTRLVDFHTVGGGLPQHRTVPTAKGARRAADAATIVSRRHYLSDAVFTVAVTASGSGSPALLAECAEALSTPRWPLHQGRRSCPPGSLFLLRAASPDPVAELLELPLARTAPHLKDKDSTVTVQFTADTPFAGAAETTAPPGEGPPGTQDSASGDRTAVTMLNDEPVRLTSQDRAHRTRPAFATSRRLPAALCGGYGSDYLEALDRYLPERPGGAAP